MPFPVLTPGSAFTGILGADNDSDVYELPSVPGAVLAVAVTGSVAEVVLLDEYIRTIARSGPAVDGVLKLTYLGLQTARYVMIVAPENVKTGSYSVRWVTRHEDDYRASTATQGTLALNATAGGQLDYLGDHDWFAVTLQQGSAYNFKLGGGAASLAVYGADGRLLQSGLAGYAPATSGTYYIDVSGSDFLVGYTIGMTRTPDDYAAVAATKGKLAMEGKVSGKIDAPGDSDWFAVTLRAGQRYAFAFDAATSASPHNLALYDAAGTLLKQNSVPPGPPGMPQPLDYAAGAAGIYYVAVSDSAGGTGSYALKATPLDDYPDHSRVRIMVGEVKQGTMDSKSDQDIFTIALKAGSFYRIALLKQQGDGALDLGNAELTAWPSFRSNASSVYQDANGDRYLNLLASEDADCSLVVGNWLSSALGSYELAVTAYGADDYSNVRSGATLIEAGKPLTAVFEQPGDTDWFKVALQAGTHYKVTLASADSVYAYNYTAKVRLDDNTGSRSEAGYGAAGPVSFVFTPPKSGTYDLEALMANGAETNYVLTLTTVRLPDGKVPRPLSAEMSKPDGLIAANSQLAISYDAPLLRGKGTLTFALEGDTAPASYDIATSPNVKIQGGTLYLQLDHPVKGGKFYAYTLSAGALSDEDGDLAYANAGSVFSDLSGHHYHGHSGSQQFNGISNANYYDGGPGIDTISYRGSRGQFDVVKTAAGYSVTQRSSKSGGDMLENMERVQFDDAAIALDVAGTGVAGQAYRLYRAAFDRTPDETGIGYWIAVMDRGASLRAVASNFLSSTEFSALYGSKTGNAAFVDTLYQNVLHRAPDATGRAFWIDTLLNGTERAAVLADFSESAENTAAVAALIGNGFAYLPYL